MTREEAIDHLSVVAERMNDKGRMIYVGDIALEAVDMAIEALQERKTGRWIVSQVDGQFHCSACNQLLWNTAVLALGGLPNACPWCTVKMEVEG